MQLLTTVQWEILINPHFNSFDEINFEKLLDITKLIQLIWDSYIDWSRPNSEAAKSYIRSQCLLYPHRKIPGIKYSKNLCFVISVSGQLLNTFRLTAVTRRVSIILTSGFHQSLAHSFCAFGNEYSSLC